MEEEESVIEREEEEPESIVWRVITIICSARPVGKTKVRIFRTGKRNHTGPLLEAGFCTCATQTAPYINQTDGFPISSE